MNKFLEFFIHFYCIYSMSICLCRADNDKKCFVLGECTNSNVLTVLRNCTSEYNCLSTCKNTEHCEWFTHYDNTKVCTLFAGCERLSDLNCVKCFSGKVSCELDNVCNKQVRCLGTMLQFPLVSDEAECGEKCTKKSKCNWYTYDNSTKKCLLLYDCTDFQTCDSCVTSERSCMAQKRSRDVLLLRQDLSAKSNLFTEDTIRSHNRNDITAKMYSRLGEMEDFIGKDDKYHFKLCYPKLSHFTSDQSCFEFEQSSHPEELTNASIETKGLKLLKHPNTWEDDPKAPFNGLRSDSTDNSYLDGNKGKKWWYAVGVKKLYGGKYPGPYPSKVDLIELYAIV